MQKLGLLLREFRDRLSTDVPLPPDCDLFFCSEEAPTVCLGSMIHGNEFGSLPALVELQRQLREGRIQPQVNIFLLLGNGAAALQNQRFLEEDLNRVFTFDRTAASLERRRAEELRPILDQVDTFLDIHQTQTPTESAFYTFPWTNELGEWARALGAAPLGLTRASGASFSPGTCCLDEYVRARGKVGLTVEIGFRGFDELQEERAFRAMCRFIELSEALLVRGESLDSYVQAAASIGWYQTSYIENQFEAGSELRPGLTNWLEVKKGEVLSRPGSPVLKAPESGRILFPKYAQPGQPLPPELYRLATPIADPEQL